MQWLTFKGVSHIADVRHPLQIPGNGVKVDKEPAEQDSWYRRDGAQEDAGLDAQTGAD